MQNSATLDQLLATQSDKLRPFFKPQMLGRSHTVFSFQFDSEPAFYLEVTEDSFRLSAGQPEAATITLYVENHATCWQLLSGEADSMAAFMAGKYRADGNIVLSQLVLYLFRNDDLTIAYEVKE